MAGHRSTEQRLPWWVDGISHSLTGLPLGLFINLIFVISLGIGLNWAVSLETWGTDFGQRYLAAFEGPSGSRTADVANYGQPSIVFLDIDEAACAALQTSDRNCRAGMSGYGNLLPALGEALKPSGASLLVLDVMIAKQRQLDRDDSLAAALRSAWVEGSGPLVVAAVPLSPALGRESAWIDWDQALVNGPTKGRLRFAVALARPTPSIGDSVLRHIPTAVTVQVGPEEFQLPSIALAAAAYSSSSSLQAHVDCVLYSQAQGSDVKSCGQKMLNIGKLSIPVDSEQKMGAKLVEVSSRDANFKLRPLLEPNGAPAIDARDAFWGVWNYYPLRDFIKDARIEFPANVLRGKIVIIGSSAAAADDWHLTPLGYMSGAEVVANQIVAIRQDAFIKRPSFIGRFINAIIDLFTAATVMSPFWFLIFYVDRRQIKSPRTRSVAKKALVTVIFLAGSVTTFAVMLWISVYGSQSSNKSVVDFLIPTIAVLLEGFAEGARTLTTFAESQIGSVVRSLYLRYFGARISTEEES